MFVWSKSVHTICSVLNGILNHSFYNTKGKGERGFSWNLKGARISRPVLIFEVRGNNLGKIINKK